MADARWDPCISSRDADAVAFLQAFFADPARRVMLICGAGFDPRSTQVATHLATAAPGRVSGHFIREERPDSDPALRTLADANEAELRRLVPDHHVHHVEVFSSDGKTVVAGRRIAQIFAAASLAGITDILLDMSALSTGVTFPLVAFFHARARQGDFPNVHVMVCTSPEVDDAVQTELTDRAQIVPGIGSALGLSAGQSRPKLWLPQLGRRSRAALDRIFGSAFGFVEICPILPFPASRPRAAEELLEQYLEPINGAWAVDDRDFLYAAEDDPLDLYRTILRVDSQRQATFQIEGGSLTVLSPLGTKAMALGALLAALERDLPVVYVEAQRYTMAHMPHPAGSYGLIHLWLTGEAYP